MLLSCLWLLWWLLLQKADDKRAPAKPKATSSAIAPTATASAKVTATQVKQEEDDGRDQMEDMLGTPLEKFFRKFGSMYALANAGRSSPLRCCGIGVRHWCAVVRCAAMKISLGRVLLSIEAEGMIVLLAHVVVSLLAAPSATVRTVHVSCCNVT